MTLAAIAVLACTPSRIPDDDAAAKQPPSGKQAYSPTRLDWAAMQGQDVFASVLAAHARREWVMVEPHPPNTLVVHIVPVDGFVDMNALQQEGELLKGMWRPDRDGWSPELEIRIEPGGTAHR